MQTVTVKRSDLLAKVQANRNAHRDLFLKAQDGYRTVVIDLLDKMLLDARAGRKVETRVRVQAPEDHTEDYDRVISMLEMSVDDEIQLTAQDFNRYVRDKWEWADIARWKNSTYAIGASVDEHAMYGE